MWPTRPGTWSTTGPTRTPLSGAWWNATRRSPGSRREAAAPGSRLASGEGAPGAIRRSRQGALDRLSLRGRSDARPGYARVPARRRGARRPADRARRDRVRHKRECLALRRPPARLAHPRAAGLGHRDHQPRELLRGAVHALSAALRVDLALRVLLRLASRGVRAADVPRGLVRRGAGRAGR